MHAGRSGPRRVVGECFDQSDADPLTAPRRIQIDVEVRGVARREISEARIEADVIEARCQRRVIERADEIADQPAIFVTRDEGVRAIVHEIAAEPALAESIAIGIVGEGRASRRRKKDALDAAQSGIGCIISEGNDCHHACLQHVPPTAGVRTISVRPSFARTRRFSPPAPRGAMPPVQP